MTKSEIADKLKKAQNIVLECQQDSFEIQNDELTTKINLLFTQIQQIRSDLYTK